MSTITVGTWVYYCGTHAGLHGQLLEVEAVNSDRLTLKGPLFRVHCRATSVRVAQPGG